MGCEPARKGACGESFIGSFKCSFKSECTSEKECICTVNAQCTKANDQAQEVAEKNSKETLRSVPTKVKPGTEAKIKSATKKNNGIESHKGKVSINQKMIHDKTYIYFLISKKLKNKDKESKTKSAIKRNHNQSKKGTVSINKNTIKNP